MAIDTDKLKRETDIVQVVGHYTKLTKRGHEFIGQCVAHNDSNASMTVSPQKGFAHCFACGFHADVIDFIMEVESLDFKAAAEFLGATNDWKPSLAVPAAPEVPIVERVTVKPPLNTRPKKISITIKQDDKYIVTEPLTAIYLVFVRDMILMMGNSSACGHTLTMRGRLVRSAIRAHYLT
jgi:CHC2 zinc finger